LIFIYSLLDAYMATKALNDENTVSTSSSLTSPIITLDGPTASGKGTIAKAVAERLGFHYLDSGALYRVVALASLQDIPQNTEANATPEYINAIVERIRTLDIVFSQEQILLNGQDVTQAIRAEAVGQQASALAVHIPIRAALLDRQRAFHQPPGLVADGRDMGTVVFTQASLKIFLTASVEARAERRYAQLQKQGLDASISMSALLKNLQERDARDCTRAVAPLKPAPDAKILDTSTLSIDAVVALVMQWFSVQ
jgi:cytidylate kinase